MPKLSVQPFINQINSAQKLKDAEKENAITGLIRIEQNLGANFFSEADNLSEAFIWDKTIEGREFWVKINNVLFKVDTDGQTLLQ